MHYNIVDYYKCFFVSHLFSFDVDLIKQFRRSILPSVQIIQCILAAVFLCVHNTKIHSVGFRVPEDTGRAPTVGLRESNTQDDLLLYRVPKDMGGAFAVGLRGLNTKVISFQYHVPGDMRGLQRTLKIHYGYSIIPDSVFVFTT
jgi:hypothetical protein